MRIRFILIIASGLAAFGAGCTTTAEAPKLTQARLMGSPWRVISINDGGVEGQTVTIRFNERLMASGEASCNSYASDYRLEGNELKFGQAIATMKACDPETMELEQRFLATLAQVSRADIAPDGALVLYAGEAGRIVARKG
jgi:heat shock protein HslJ